VKTGNWWIRSRKGKGRAGDRGVAGCGARGREGRNVSCAAENTRSAFTIVLCVPHVTIHRLYILQFESSSQPSHSSSFTYFPYIPLLGLLHKKVSSV
jgi:hypothetical protein